MKKKQLKKPGKGSFDAKGLGCVAAGFLALLSLVSFHAYHPSSNWLGFLGYASAFGSVFLFGLGSYLIPLYCFWRGSRFLQQPPAPASKTEHLYFLILLGSACILLSVFAEQLPDRAAAFEDRVITETVILDAPYPRTLTRHNLGGIPFYFLFRDLPYVNLQRILSTVGTTLIFSTLSLLAFLLITRVRIFSHLTKLRAITTLVKRAAAQWKATKPKPVPPVFAAPPPKITSPPKYSGLEQQPVKKTYEVKEAPPAPKPVKKNIEEVIAETILPKPVKPAAPEAVHLPALYEGPYKLPSPNLLNSPAPKVDQPTLKKDLKRQSAVLEETLRSFGIEAKVGEIHSGPTITSFEVHPSIGVKVQKIKALENDIALNMQAKSIRIVAPIPGKAAVGVEVPAIHPQEVNFKELLLNYQQKGRKLQVPILLGKGVSGDPVFSDLARMPHLLIAGATGSGKSVCINTIVLSMLMNARPEEIRLMMIDPKKVELTQYSRLPHMIAPVITEAHGAYAALQWLVKEMQMRYEILKQLGLRNITAFNSRKVNPDIENSLSIPIPPQLPMIVAIIDEFADLMMVSSADLETPIARIAQMARAVGIHLILATQRPSREVITGIIKANIPCRIAFKVASRINSQIILDDVGAESLLGNGDCLFLPPGSSQLLRAQGAFVSDEEINQIIKAVTSEAPPSYLIPSFDAMRLPDAPMEEGAPKGKDALYDQALSIVLQTKIASTTYLQRKLKIGYARAASLMDELEENGVISANDGSRRRVLSGSNQDADLYEDSEER